MKKWLSRALVALFPTLQLDTIEWWNVWNARDRAAVLRNTRLALLIGIIGHVAHYFFIDRRFALEPAWVWQAERFGLAALCALGVLVSFTSACRVGGWHRAPMFVVGTTVAIAQAYTMNWSSLVSDWYAMLFAMVFALSLRLSPFVGTIYLFVVYGVIWRVSPPLGDMASYVTASKAGALLLLYNVVRGGLADEIRQFVVAQQKMQVEKTLIEAQLALTDEIRAFLPREIFHRISSRASRKGVTMLQAVDDVLRPREQFVACVFSDIRGFTLRSKDSGYIANAAIPNIRICTEIVEEHRGVPKLIGDLVFAYFDHPESAEALVAGLAGAAQLATRNDDWNESAPDHERVNRHVLFSFGKAIVGNIGGADSSRDITALGSCVNILSRIDMLTKHPAIVPYVNRKCIVMTREAWLAISAMFPQLEFDELHLADLGVELRDFPEERSIFVLALHGENSRFFQTDTRLQSATLNRRHEARP